MVLGIDFLSIFLDDADEEGNLIFEGSNLRSDDVLFL